MRLKKIIVLVLVLTCSLSAFGCSGNDDSSSTGADSTGDVHADSVHGKVTSVTYSCSGGDTVESTFSYYAAEVEDGYVFNYVFYGDEGRVEGESMIEDTEMNELRAIIEKYGYSEKVGQREEPDFGNEEALDAPSYYFSVSYEDGKSMTSSTAGDGAFELEPFFRLLAEKVKQ